jgi:CheY-like chemotaxis protein
LLEADAARLQQVFATQLANAARYSARDCRVWVTVERVQLPDETLPGITPDGRITQPYAVVHVRDEGIGIDSDMLSHIFDLFAQGNEATPGQGVGLGIGLNLARRLVELHGGRITATSPGKEKGSEFIVYLPVEEASDLRRESWSETGATALPVGAEPLRVLVVDDNPDAAEMLTQLLVLAEQDVRSANDGPGALRIAKEFRPQLVLLDIAMPDMDGIEVARRMREDPDLKSAFLVAVTGFSPGDATFDISNAGFNERVTKPLEYDALLTLLARVQHPRTRKSA